MFDTIKYKKEISKIINFANDFNYVTWSYIKEVFGDLSEETYKEIEQYFISKNIDIVKDENDESEPSDEELAASIVNDYIDNSSIKISIYQDIAYCTNDEDIQNITDEIIDRFGTFPPEVENLLKVAKIKVLCREKNIYKISNYHPLVHLCTIKPYFTLIANEPEIEEDED